MANIPKIANLLNTNLISKQNHENQQSHLNAEAANNISIPKLQRLLAQNFGSIIGTGSAKNTQLSGLELVGQGINGTIYKIKHSNKDYICKCIGYSRENIDQIEYEIELIKQLQQNEIAVRYINPCLGMAITREFIITIFPQFHASTLDQIIATMQLPEFNTPQRISLIKYLIYQMILGLTEMHRLGICHRQINSGSVLIEVNPATIGTINGAGAGAGTNSALGQIWYTEEYIPLRVKYTNFGFGCLNTCLPMLSNLDPHQPNGPADFDGSQKYDVWCLGLLFMKLLHVPGSKKLIAPELEKFLDVVQNHMLVPLEKRKSADYVKDTFAINDKLYDDLGSDGSNETQNLVEQVLKKII
jgi:serine/threonine protein kinase